MMGDWLGLIFDGEVGTITFLSLIYILLREVIAAMGAVSFFAGGVLMLVTKVLAKKI